MNKPQKMLLGIAIGDAFGAGYEFAYKTRQEYKDKSLTYKAHPNKEFNHKPGMYTDDTQMSIAVSLLLISDKEFNKENLADSFVNLYKLDPIIGYSKGFQGLLDSINTGDELLKK